MSNNEQFTEDQTKMLNEAAANCMAEFQKMEEKGASPDLVLNVIAMIGGNILAATFGENEQRVMQYIPGFINQMLRYKAANWEIYKEQGVRVQ